MGLTILKRDLAMELNINLTIFIGFLLAKPNIWFNLKQRCCKCSRIGCRKKKFFNSYHCCNYCCHLG